MDNKLELKKSNFFLDKYAANQIAFDKSNSSIDTYIENILNFAKWFEDTNGIPFDPSIVTEVDIRDMRTYLQNIKGLKESTINLRLASLKSYFSYLEFNGYIKNNPAKNIKRIKSQGINQSKSIDDNIYNALKRQVYRDKNPSHICMFNILSHGLRVSELIFLKLTDVDIKERKGTLRVTGKGNKIRYVPINNECRISIMNWLEIRKNIKTYYDNIFISERKCPFTRSGIWKIFSKISKKVGADDITVHSYRHHFCRTLLKNGVDLSVVAQLAGHSNGYVTAQVYTIPKDPGELAAAIEKL